MPFGPSHSFLRKVALWTMQGFFSEIKVIGADGELSVPREGPLVVCCTHWNMIVDPAILSCYFPYGRKLHYWAKSTIFINKPVSALLKDAGNIPVDRKTKDNQKLFSGTFDVLKQGEVVAIFPEGTSYTEPKLQAIKDGASWAILEYGKNLRQTEDLDKADGIKDATLVVASIVYTDKTRYRSRAVLQFSRPVDTRDCLEQFMQSSTTSGTSTPIAEDDPRKLAVRELTKRIREQMIAMTVNAPDWDTLRAAETARQLLWGEDARVPLDVWTDVSQFLVDLFTLGPHAASSTTALAPQIESARSTLLEYNAILRSLKFTNASLNAIPLPRVLDPLHPALPPDRLRSLWALFKASLSSLFHLPFFVLPLLAHLPAYILGKTTQIYLNVDEPEAYAQNKIVFSLLALLFLSYPTIFLFTWFIFLGTPVGFLVAAAWTALLVWYHNNLVDRNYAGWKKLVAAWRILVGLWWPTYVPAGGASWQARESPVRAMLRLRSEAAKSTVDLLLTLEHASSEDAGELAHFVRRIDWLRRNGARIGTLQAHAISDPSGRLRSS